MSASPCAESDDPGRTVASSPLYMYKIHDIAGTTLVSAAKIALAASLIAYIQDGSPHRLVRPIAERSVANLSRTHTTADAYTKDNIQGLVNLWPVGKSKGAKEITTTHRKDARKNIRVNLSPLLNMADLYRDYGFDADQMIVGILYHKYVLTFTSEKDCAFEDAKDSHTFYINLRALSTIMTNSDSEDPLAIVDPVTQVPYCSEMLERLQALASQRIQELAEAMAEQDPRPGQDTTDPAPQRDLLERFCNLAGVSPAMLDRMGDLKKRFFASTHIPPDIKLKGMKFPTEHVAMAVLKHAGWPGLAALVNSARQFETSLALGSTLLRAILALVEEMKPHWRETLQSWKDNPKLKEFFELYMKRKKGDAFSAASLRYDHLVRYAQRVLQLRQKVPPHLRSPPEDPCRMEHRWDLEANALVARAQKEHMASRSLLTSAAS